MRFLVGEVSKEYDERFVILGYIVGFVLFFVVIRNVLDVE